MFIRQHSAPSGRRKKLTTAIAVLATAALVAAACGDKKQDAATTTAAAAPETTAASTETTAAPTETTAAPTETTGVVPPTGEPINVWVLTTVDSSFLSYPNIKAAGDIYESYINDRGGIAGRPLKVTFCDGKTDPNEDAACARKAVADKAVALVGGFDIDMSLAIGVLEEGNTAWFGACCPIVAKEYTSPISFNLGSAFDFNIGSAYKLNADGCKNISMVYLEANADFAISQTKIGMEKVGYAGKVEYYVIPSGTTDYSSVAAKATDGDVDCLYGGFSDIAWLGFIPAMEALGVKPRLYGVQGNFNVKVAEAFPEATENGVVINAYPNIAAKAWTPYRDALEQYNAPDLDWNSLAGLGTWAAFEAFRKIVEQMAADGITDINHSSFIDAANKTSNLKMDNMIGDIDFTKPWAGAGGTFPRVFNHSISFDSMSGGKLTPQDDKTYDMISYWS
ncbi:unannotated protein [freshwater metagenome]|uniref:Unannotated protein n=1 Tax=freshwater metagenome TaxID=449393 RepID=A0A6J7EX83_9ZZZZ